MWSLRVVVPFFISRSALYMFDVFQMASSPAFNVWMFIWSMRVVVTFFISRSTL